LTGTHVEERGVGVRIVLREVVGARAESPQVLDHIVRKRFKAGIFRHCYLPSSCLPNDYPEMALRLSRACVSTPGGSFARVRLHALSPGRLSFQPCLELRAEPVDLPTQDALLFRQLVDQPLKVGVRERAEVGKRFHVKPFVRWRERWFSDSGIYLDRSWLIR